MRDEGLDPTLRFLQTLWELDHALHARSKAMNARLGVTGQQRFALRLIGMRGQATSSELCRLMHLHPSTLTGMFRRLEERGLVVRTTDPADARRALLELTPRGQRATAPNEVCIEAAVRRVLARIDGRHQREVQRVVSALAAELEAPPRRSGTRKLQSRRN